MTPMVPLLSPSSLSPSVNPGIFHVLSLLVLWVWILKSLLICSHDCFRFLPHGSWASSLCLTPVSVSNLHLLDLRGVFALWSVSRCSSGSFIFRQPLILLWASSRYLRTHPAVAPCPDSHLSFGIVAAVLDICFILSSMSSLSAVTILHPSTNHLVTLREVLLMMSVSVSWHLNGATYVLRVADMLLRDFWQSNHGLWIHSRRSISSDMSTSKWIHINFAFLDRQE